MDIDLTQVFTGTGIGILMLDGDAVVRDANDDARRYFEDPSDLAGRPLADLSPRVGGIDLTSALDGVMTLDAPARPVVSLDAIDRDVLVSLQPATGDQLDLEEVYGDVF